MTLRLNVPDLAFAAFLVAFGALAFALAGELSVGTAAPTKKIGRHATEGNGSRPENAARTPSTTP